jgi:hypothetical protein
MLLVQTKKTSWVAEICFGSYVQMNILSRPPSHLGISAADTYSSVYSVVQTICTVHGPTMTATDLYQSDGGAKPENDASLFLVPCTQNPVPARPISLNAPIVASLRPSYSFGSLRVSSALRGKRKQKQSDNLYWRKILFCLQERKCRQIWLKCVCTDASRDCTLCFGPVS